VALRETSDPALVARLQRVHESATRGAHLVNQLLTLARAEPESAHQHDRVPWIAPPGARVTAEMVPRALAAASTCFDEATPDRRLQAQVRGIACCAMR
jgi:two-component system sensor histidine kinase TctE